MTILHDPPDYCLPDDPDDTVTTICTAECEHPECIHALADLWADATAPLTPPF